MAEYYLQRAECERFDKVDKYTFDNWKYAMHGDRPRYNGNKVIRDDRGFLTLNLVNVNERVLAIVARFTGSKENLIPGSVPGGFVAEQPGLILFVKGPSRFLHDPDTGERWRKAA